MSTSPFFPAPDARTPPGNLTARGVRLRQIGAWVQILIVLGAFFALHDKVGYWWRLALVLPAYGAEICWLQAREKT